MVFDTQSLMEKLQDKDTLPLVLTPVDVAKLLGVSRNTGYEVIHSKGFPYFMVGKQYRVRLDKLLQWIEEETEKREKEAA